MAPELVLHAGSGSFVAARGLDGAVHYAGGLGWKFGDAGSGFEIGRLLYGVRSRYFSQSCKRAVVTTLPTR